MQTYRLRDVFVAGGIPKLTYVPRENLKLEKQLKTALAEGHQIIALTGPTKSGKTVLCRRVLSKRETVWVDGGQIDTTDDFWKLAADRLGIPAEEVESQNNSTSAGFRYLLSVSGSKGEASQSRYAPSAKSAVLETCKANGSCLVVDDFHYLEDNVQKSIIRTLKSEIFDGLDAIVIAVPHRAFDTIRNEREMEGRFVHIEIPSWGTSELEEIASVGFPALGVTFPRAKAKKFAEEAFGSPILMQRFCLKVCTEHEVLETQNPGRELNPSDHEIAGIFGGVAENYGFPTFKILSEGPQSRTDRLERKVRGESDLVDIYQALLRSVARTGPKSSLTYDEIRDAMRATLEESSMPQKQQMTNSLNYMSREAREK